MTTRGCGFIFLVNGGEWSVPCLWLRVSFLTGMFHHVIWDKKKYIYPGSDTGPDTQSFPLPTQQKRAIRDPLVFFYQPENIELTHPSSWDWILLSFYRPITHSCLLISATRKLKGIAETLRQSAWAVHSTVLKRRHFKTIWEAKEPFIFSLSLYLSFHFSLLDIFPVVESKA